MSEPVPDPLERFMRNGVFTAWVHVNIDMLTIPAPPDAGNIGKKISSYFDGEGNEVEVATQKTMEEFGLNITYFPDNTCMFPLAARYYNSGCLRKKTLADGAQWQTFTAPYGITIDTWKTEEEMIAIRDSY